MSGSRQRRSGFTLLELLIATAIFMVVCAAMFTLLQVSQEKYAIESQMSGSFQEVRLGLDQIVRDINISGYPSANLLANTTNPLNYAQNPFAWSPGYASTVCQIGSCASPTDQDLIVETNPYPGNTGSTVSWIHYQYVNNVLYRGVIAKTSGDPLSAFASGAVMTPLVNNVVNYASGALLDQINAEYPTITEPQPIFVYTCTTPTGPQLCASAPAPYNEPQYISDVDITLIVQTPQQDMQTQALKLIELTGRGHRNNAVN
jgi:prepilin-type N-terminal cleavage/methylation domain-containing protein